MEGRSRDVDNPPRASMQELLCICYHWANLTKTWKNVHPKRNLLDIIPVAGRCPAWLLEGLWGAPGLSNDSAGTKLGLVLTIRVCAAGKRERERQDYIVTQNVAEPMSNSACMNCHMNCTILWRHCDLCKIQRFSDHRGPKKSGCEGPTDLVQPDIKLKLILCNYCAKW